MMCMIVKIKSRAEGSRSRKGDKISCTFKKCIRVDLIEKITFSPLISGYNS